MAALWSLKRLRVDFRFSQGGFILVAGSFGIMEFKGSVAATLKVVLADWDLKTAAPTPQELHQTPISCQRTRLAEDSVIKPVASDTPGGLFVVFQPLPTYETNYIDGLYAGKVGTSPSIGDPVV